MDKEFAELGINKKATKKTIVKKTLSSCYFNFYFDTLLILQPFAAVKFGLTFLPFKTD